MTAKNVEPTPGSLCTETLPPSNSASFRDRGRPSPVPFTRFWTGPSTWLNSSKIAPLVLRGDPDAGVGHREDDRVARTRPWRRGGSRRAR